VFETVCLSAPDDAYMRLTLSKASDNMEAEKAILKGIKARFEATGKAPILIQTVRNALMFYDTLLTSTLDGNWFVASLSLTPCIA